MGGCGCGNQNQAIIPAGSSALPQGGLEVVPDALTLLERGRRMALNMMRTNPTARERVERTYGLDYAKARYPELYGINKPPVLDEPQVIVNK